jgi:hypothetical protein
MQNNLDVFVDRLVKEKGFNETDPDVIAQIKSDLVSRMEDRINAMIIRELGEEKLGEFQKLLETGKTEEVQEYVKKNVSEMDEKIAKELLAFRTIYLS